MKTFKLFVGNAASVAVICPSCGKSRSIESAKIPANVNSFRAKCSCGEVFTVSVERRRSYRKEARLMGKLSSGAGAFRTLSDIVVTDISMSGLKFNCLWNQGPKVDIVVGDEFLVRVNLESDEDARVEGRVVVRNIRVGNIGAEFVSLDEHSRKKLGFFMMP